MSSSPTPCTPITFRPTKGMKVTLIGLVQLTVHLLGEEKLHRIALKSILNTIKETAFFWVYQFQSSERPEDVNTFMELCALLHDDRNI